MKKIFLSICICAFIAVASSCGSNKATNAADGNNALLDSSKKTQDSTNATTPKVDTAAKSDTAKKM